MLYTLYHPSPVGLLRLEADGTGLCGVALQGDAELGEASPCPLLAEAAAQLDEYFAGGRRAFTLPLSLHGTPFQRRVWAALCQIPYGETGSYGQVAAAVGSPKACRAVGMANNRNPVMIVVPCHRVIGADGSLVGYGGGLAVKRALLALEAQAGPA